MDPGTSRKCPNKPTNASVSSNKKIATIRHASIINNQQKNIIPLNHEIELPTSTTQMHDRNTDPNLVIIVQGP